MVIVVVLVVVLIFVPLLLWGLSRVRANRAGQPTSAGGRGSNNVVTVLFMLALVILYGNHDNASSQVGGVKLTAEAKSGRILFGEHCAVCHTLSAANAIGKVGPDLDILKPPESLVLHTIANGCLPNASGSNQNETCLGEGVMPSEVVTGTDAQDVASFVAEAAGH